MRLSQLLSRTLRDAPAEAEIPSHQLLIRAGLVQQLAAGSYSLLPLGWRALRKVEAIVRQEMDAAGGQEVHMPIFHPTDVWAASGRLETFVPPLLKVKDRRERELVVAPTHEEVIVEIFKRQVQSYKELPVLPYQIQSKFRDEPRPRAGLIRLREFTMMDLYSFDESWEALDRTYDAVAEACVRLFTRCGVPVITVDADSGPIGGKDSQELIYLTDIGEDSILICESCGYAANEEKADHRKARLPEVGPLPMDEVATPGMKTIEEVATFLDVPVEGTLKAVFYAASGSPVFVAIRGDLEVNEIKLRNALDGAEPRMMTDAEVEAAGLVAGSASPVGLKEGIRVVADDSVRGASNLVAGANKPDTHLKNVNFERDWDADVVADIALARTGDGCPHCDGTLEVKRGIEVGHIFKLGTVYTDKMGGSFLDAEGKQQNAVMGCYGIGMDRLLASVIEANHDDRGIVWPAAVAPFAVHIVALKPDLDEVRETAEALYRDLTERGVEVLYDDREESPGVKFADADLLGMPLRVTVSPRSLEKDSVELKRRSSEETELVAKSDAAERIAAAAQAVASPVAE